MEMKKDNHNQEERAKRINTHWARKKEIKEQVIAFILLMMEEYKIYPSDLQ
jgi:hypothetical protein